MSPFFKPVWCISIISYSVSFSFFFLCLFRATSAGCGASQARDGKSDLHLPAYTTTTLDPSGICNLHCHLQKCWSLTHWARPGIKPTSSQRQRQVLNSLSHNRNSIIQFLRAQHPCFSRTFFVSSYPGFPKRLSHELFLWVFSQPCMVQIFMGIFCFLIQGFHF